jgi:hypothetical protein
MTVHFRHCWKHPRGPFLKKAREVDFATQPLGLSGQRLNHRVGLIRRFKAPWSANF